jgi:hypothetical protein
VRKMRRMLVVLLLGCLLGCLSGCAGTPQSRESGSNAVVSLLGAEGAGGKLTLYAATEGRGDEDAQMFHGQGATPAAAVEALIDQGRQVVNSAHVEHLLLGEDSPTLLPELLSYAFQQPEQSTETQLWVVRGKGLKETFTPEADPAQRMNVLKAAGQDRQGFEPLTLREAAAALAEGRALLIPALASGEEGLYFWGYALYGEGRFTGWLTGNAALGAALLQGQRIHWTASAGDQAVLLQSRGCRVAPVLEEGKLTGLVLRCQLEGVAAGGWEAADTQQLEQETAQAMKEALRCMQFAGSDGAGIDRQATLRRPAQWTTVHQQWEAAFPGLKYQVEVGVTMAERY